MIQKKKKKKKTLTFSHGIPLGEIIYLLTVQFLRSEKQN